MDDVQIIVHSLSALSYGGIFILFLLVNMLMPFPEEILIMTIGYLGSAELINMYTAGILAILGLLISDIILFSLIRRGNKFLSRIGRILLKDSFTENSAFFKKHVKKIIFFSRFLVGFRFMGPFTAGTLKIKLSTFIFYDALAILIFVPVLIFIGNYFHNKFSEIVDSAGILKYSILILFLILLLSYFSRFFRRTLLKKFFS